MWDIGFVLFLNLEYAAKFFFPMAEIKYTQVITLRSVKKFHKYHLKEQMKM